MQEVHKNRADAPSAAVLPTEEPGIWHIDVRAWNAPEWAGAVFVVIPRGLVLEVDGWHDAYTLSCHEVTDAEVLRGKGNLPHYGPR